MMGIQACLWISLLSVWKIYLKNGLAVKVNFFKLEKGVSTVSTAHFRMTEDGGAWIAMEDGWHAVNEGAARVESEAVRLIREEMGKKSAVISTWDKLRHSGREK